MTWVRLGVLALRGLGWATDKLPAHEPHPAQSAFERKRHLSYVGILIYPALGFLGYGAAKVLPQEMFFVVPPLLLVLLVSFLVWSYKLDQKWKKERDLAIRTPVARCR